MKAILVLNEMPVRCLDCPCMYVVKTSHTSECVYCKAIIDKKDCYPKIENICERPKWCPLKEMPQPRILPKDEIDGTAYGLEPYFSDGFNACLEIIGGIENEN